MGGKGSGRPKKSDKPLSEIFRELHDDIEGFRRHYHVLFDRPVIWKKNTHIMAWVCLESKNEGLIRWFLMQCIKESSTLRVSSKKEKPSPIIVFRYGMQDKEIKSFLMWRKPIKRLEKTRVF